MDWGSIFQGIGSLAGGYMNYKSGSQLQGMIDQANTFNAYRPAYAQMLAGLMTDPSSVTSTPGYQFGMDQAEQQVQRQLASKGLVGGGTMAQTMANTGAMYAGQQLNQQEQLYANLAGAWIDPTNMFQGFQAAQSQKNQGISSGIGGLGGIVGGLFGGGGGGGLFGL